MCLLLLLLLLPLMCKADLIMSKAWVPTGSICVCVGIAAPGAGVDGAGSAAVRACKGQHTHIFKLYAPRFPEANAAFVLSAR